MPVEAKYTNASPASRSRSETKVCEPRVGMVTCQELNFVDRDHLFCRPLPCARGCSSSALPTRSIMT